MKAVVPAAAAATLALVAAVPVWAGSGSTSFNGVQVALTVGERSRYDGPGCAEVPWTFSYTKQPDRGFELYVKARQPGSNTTVDWYYDRDYWDANTEAKSGTMCFDNYDADSVGRPFEVSAALEVRDDNWATLGEVPMPVPGSVVLVRNRSWFTRLKVKAGRTIDDLPVVKGKVVAQTLTHGRLGADGEVIIEGKVRGKWRTAEEDVTLDSFGRFSVEVWKQIPKGMKVRVRMVDCYWCTDARKTARAR